MKRREKRLVGLFLDEIILVVVVVVVVVVVIAGAVGQVVCRPGEACSKERISSTERERER